MQYFQGAVGFSFIIHANLAKRLIIYQQISLIFLQVSGHSNNAQILLLYVATNNSFVIPITNF